MIRRILYIFLLIFLFDCDVYANNIEDMLKVSNDIVINLDYQDNLIVKRHDLDLIKSSGKSITYNIIENNIVLYTFIFNGNYFDESYNDINLKIDFNSNKDNYINEYFNKKIIINTLYEGYYPKGTILSVNNDINIKNINIYKLNDDKFKKINILNNKENFIDINIKKGGIYIISNKELISMEVIKLYLIILFVLIIEILLFVVLIYKNKIKSV